MTGNVKTERQESEQDVTGRKGAKLTCKCLFNLFNVSDDLVDIFEDIPCSPRINDCRVM